MTETSNAEADGRDEKGFVEAFAPRLIEALRSGYSIADFKTDVVAGFSVAVVSLPLAMALAVASGLSPSAGLSAAIVGGFITSLLGGSSYQIGGPATAFVALVAKTVESHGVQGLLAATIMAGLILLALGYMRFGSYIKYLPHSVPVGFTAGVAVILLASQARDFLGLEIAHEPAGFLPKLEAISGNLGGVHFQSLLLACATLAFVVYQRKRQAWWGGMLTTIAAGAAVAWLLGLDVGTIGSRYGGIPDAALKAAAPGVSLATLLELTPTAIAIATLSAIESLLSAVVADGMTGERHNSNAELVAQGWANVFCGFFGGVSSAGALTRTATNIRAGAKTPLAGISCALFLLLFVSIAAPLAAHIPLPTLAAVLVVIAWDMIDRKAILSIFRRDKEEALLLCVTLLLTVFRDATEGIAVGVSFGSLLFMHRMAEYVEWQIRASQPLTQGTKGPQGAPSAAGRSEGALVYRFEGPLFFGVASTIFDALERISPPPSSYVIDFHMVPFIDGSAAESFLAFAEKAHEQGRRVVVAGAARNVRRKLIANQPSRRIIEFSMDEEPSVAAPQPPTRSAGIPAGQAEQIQLLAPNRE
ncbi:SulP family inorganic anion transporter [Methylocystis heyeri]|nr:SulP family inorganic anion transporter [Methylocystis heyeri]